MTQCITNLNQLGEYDISLETAFVPDMVTASSLPPLFTPVEVLLVDPPLADAIASSRLRSKVHDLPQYQRDDVLNLDMAEQRRLFVILTFVAQGYVWGNGKDSVEPQLAEQIAVPLDYLGKLLGITPLGTYASTVLWNSRLKDPVKGWILENVSIDFTFTGTEDESWFYKISVCIEAAGARALTSLLSILFEVQSKHPCHEKIIAFIAEAEVALRKMLAFLKQTSKMDPAVFYWKIRPYFFGWQHVKPFGVRYVGVDEPSIYRTYLGISAHQSTLFQALDVILGVTHRPGASYVQDIRKHMPAPHARFLESLRTQYTVTLRAFFSGQSDLVTGYNRIVGALASFREIHKAFAQKYAVSPASLSGQAEFGPAQNREDGGGIMGAGGTVIGDFLGSMHEDTRSARLPATDQRS